MRVINNELSIGHSCISVDVAGSLQAARVLRAGVAALQRAGVSRHLQLRREQDRRRHGGVRSRSWVLLVFAVMEKMQPIQSVTLRDGLRPRSVNCSLVANCFGCVHCPPIHF